MIGAGTGAGEGIVIIGGGPAGLMAAEAACRGGAPVDLYEAKGSVGRKFLIAGKGGLNLTHADPPARFAARYREREHEVRAWLHGFDAEAVRSWAAELGVATFVGSSGRVFPHDLKAAPLLRAWVRRLRGQGLRIHVQHRWQGWNANGSLRLVGPQGPVSASAAATVLATGGGSWPQLGSDGAWQEPLAARDIDLAPLQPANCGFDIAWSPHFAGRHAGAPLKPVRAMWLEGGAERSLQGECVVTATGIEGSLIYALSAPLRQTIAAAGPVGLWLDLAPGRAQAQLQAVLAMPSGGRSLTEILRRRAGLSAVKAGLLIEVLGRDAGADSDRLARTIKRLPLTLQRPRPLAEAISSAGGVRLEELDSGLMLHRLPGVFCAGEMLDWEAPTGGYLLTACLASGRLAGQSALAWCERRQ